MAELDYDYDGGAPPRWAAAGEDDGDEPLFDGETPRDEDVYNNEPELRGVDDIMSGVDALLSKPAPSMRQFAGRNSGPSIPVMRKQRSEARRGKKVSNASTTRRRTKPDVVPDCEPDPAMVAEALQYCQGLSMRVAADDAPPAAPAARARAAAAPPPPKRGGSRRRARGEPKKNPAETMARAYGTGPARTKKAAFSTKPQQKKRGAELDTAALVANFESGAHLTELRKQLHASQKAMEASASVVKQAARDFHGGAF
jgi:hypothetical protein